MSTPYAVPAVIAVASSATQGASAGTAVAVAAGGTASAISTGAVISAVAIAGAAVGAAAVGTVMLAVAAQGGRAVAAGIREELQRNKLLEIARRNPVQLQVERLTLRATHVDAFGRAIARSSYERLDGGRLELADGTSRPLAYAVRDRESGTFLFSVTRAPDGGIELFSFGQAGRRAAWNGYLAAIGEVARTQLAPDGWREAPRTANDQLFRLVRENAAIGRRDELVAVYDPANGQVRFTTAGRQGQRPLRGPECVNIDQLLHAFTAPPAVGPLPPSSAAAPSRRPDQGDRARDREAAR